MERVVLNALAKSAALPPDICAYGDLFAIVFRHGESLIGETDPPLAVVTETASLVQATPGFFGNADRSVRDPIPSAVAGLKA